MSSNPRPAKRLRTSSTILSDDEDERSRGRRLPLRNLGNSSSSTASSNNRLPSSSGTLNAKRLRTATAKPTRRASSTKPSPKSSPEKSRKTKKTALDDSKNKSLHNFFNRVTDEARWRQRSVTPDVGDRQSLDDIIDDDSTDEALIELSQRTGQGNSSKTSSLSSKPLPFSSQRFVPPTKSRSSDVSKLRNITKHEVDTRPWSELYAPRSLEELGVHKKKAQDVQTWLAGVLAGKIKQRILVLKGPAGSGKSTTVEIICGAHKCEIVRWRNPDTSESGALSSSLQFAEFVTRGGDYNALSLDSQEEGSTASSIDRILLVEDFPASLMGSHMATNSFRSVLLQAAASTKSSTVFGKGAELLAPPPIVLIISETLVSSYTGYTDSFTAQRLLGPELINHYGVSVIEFNPVAPTILGKAIDLVIKKEARDSGRRKIPGAFLLQKLAEIGDIRNAVNSLQLLCARSDDTNDWSGTVASRINPKRGSKSNQPLSDKEANSIKLINARETTLDMFHAAAKVCYNKRADPESNHPKTQSPPKPREHLMHLHKPEVSQVDVEELLNETGTDIQTFISTVHQNYILSCNHEDFTDYFDDCASFLSDSELLDCDGRSLTRSRARAGYTFNASQLGASDVLRQSEISFHVATRGLLFSLPYPVVRANLPGVRKMDAFKMFYPASLRIWKPTEETSGLIDLTIAQLSGRQLPGSKLAPDARGVSSWHAQRNTFSAQSTSALEHGEDDSPPRPGLHRESLILDTLPYMAKIRESQGEDTTLIKKITQMRGFDPSADADSEDERSNDPSSETTRFVQRVEAVHDSLRNQQRAKQQQRLDPKTKRNSNVEDPPIEKLWIEDDDIEDD